MLLNGFDLRQFGLVRLGDFPHLRGIFALQTRHGFGMALLNLVEFHAAPLLIFPHQSRRLFRNDRRVAAARLADVAHGLPPFLIKGLLGRFKFAFDPRLFRLQMRGGFFHASIKAPPHFRQITGDGCGQRRSGAGTKKINNRHDKKPGQRRAGLKMGNRIASKMRQRRTGRRDAEQHRRQ